MDSNVYKNCIQWVHHKWLGKLLRLESDGKYGIDLSDNAIGIEVKARHRTYAHQGWTLAAHQYDNFPRDNPTLELYWAFILYDLTKPIAELPFPDPHLSRRVRQREIWMQPWSFADAIPVANPKTGPYKYARPSRVIEANNYRTKKVRGGTLHLPKKTTLEERVNDILAGREIVPF